MSWNTKTRHRLLRSLHLSPLHSSSILFLLLLAVRLGCPAAPSSPPERETMILSTGWRVVGLSEDLEEPPDTWRLGIPPQAASIHWPGPMTISSDHPASVTICFWRPIEAPKRWLGKAVWLEIPDLEGPTRVFFNGQAVGRGELSSGAGAEIGLSSIIMPGDSNLLLLEVRGTSAARRMAKSDPPVIHTASTFHLAQLVMRPNPDSGIIWVDAGLRKFHGAGSKPAPPELDTDVYSIEFELFEGPADQPRRPVPGTHIRSVQINPKQFNLSAPLPAPGFQPWTLDKPTLYSVQATLLRDKTPLDRLWVTTGFSSWTIRNQRLQLNDYPIEIHCISFPTDLIRWAEEGAWRETEDAQKTSPSSSGKSDSALLNFVFRRRCAFWMDILNRLKTTGINMIRIDARTPRSILEAADRAGIMVEQQIQPVSRPQTTQSTGGMADAAVLGEAVRRDQSHPSLAFWRLEMTGPVNQLMALANALRRLDSSRPVFAFIHGDSRVRRPGLVYLQGRSEPQPALETADPPEKTSLTRIWNLFSRPMEPGQKLITKPEWCWTPKVGNLEPSSAPQIAERLIMARVNPMSGGCGFAVKMPAWAQLSIPEPKRLPPPGEILWPWQDLPTSRTIAASLNKSQLLISPAVDMLSAGAIQQIEVALALSPSDQPSSFGTLLISLRPDDNRRQAFPPISVRKSLNVAQFTGVSRVARVGVDLDVGSDIPLGPAILEAEVFWSGILLKSPPRKVTVTKGRGRGSP